jgi:L-aspartate oxidase
MLNNELHTDFLIIGGGLSGLFAAHHASKYGKVVVLTKTILTESSSWQAQGGIAAALSDTDSIDLHINDTLKAGRDLCNEKGVEILVDEGKDRISELIEMGMEFDMNGENLAFGREGGHSVRRIIHANGSSTGEAVLKFLINKTQNNPNIKFLINTHCIELVKKENRVIGAFALEYLNNNILTIHSNSTIIATGGYSRIYQRTSNLYSAIGEGISMAMEVGAIVKDMEFVQFHPSAFYSEKGESFLISEAVRGDGAYLLNEKLQRFMVGKHELKELAPRDVISKAIHLEIQNSEIDHVYLDLRHLDSNYIKNRFSNIYKYAKEFSIDITRDLIPISPTAHYSIGGIATDLNGKTNIDGLYAIGEVASTGVHGANRLASNSLLECLVYSKRAVLALANETMEYTIEKKFPIKNFISNKSSWKNYYDVKQRVQNVFTKYVGIIRDKDNLLKAKNEIEDIYNSIPMNENDISIIKINGVLKIADAIIQSALIREESRGSHQRIDFPNKSEAQLGHYYFVNSQLKFEKKT